MSEKIEKAAFSEKIQLTEADTNHITQLVGQFPNITRATIEASYRSILRTLKQHEGESNTGSADLSEQAYENTKRHCEEVMERRGAH